MRVLFATILAVTAVGGVGLAQPPAPPPNAEGRTPSIVTNPAFATVPARADIAAIFS